MRSDSEVRRSIEESVKGLVVHLTSVLQSAHSEMKKINAEVEERRRQRYTVANSCRTVYVSVLGVME
jgi:hypothetical protein